MGFDPSDRVDEVMRFSKILKETVWILLTEPQHCHTAQTLTSQHGLPRWVKLEDVTCER